MSVRHRNAPEDVVGNKPHNAERSELKLQEKSAVTSHKLLGLARLKDLAWAQCETLYVEVRQGSRELWA